MSLEKYIWLWSMPFLMRRGDQPQVAKECVEQYDLKPANVHYRDSRRLVHDGANIRKHLQALIDGGGVHEYLQYEVNVFRIA